MDPFDVGTTDPIAAFRAWLEEAKASEPNDPNAMALATATPDGLPSVRIVLMKSLDECGFGFYTNRESRKGGELIANPHAALCFHWKSLLRQVRVEGTISEVKSDNADRYFHSRARISQIGAWASQQSRPLGSREELEERTREYEALYPEDTPGEMPREIPRPPYWTGFVLRPSQIEFWQDRPYRLHDRLVFERSGDGWQRGRLYP